MNLLRIHYFQHVPYEDLGCIREWGLGRGHSFTATKFFEESHTPEIAEIDWLIVMGGPMNICEEDRYPWLRQEKLFIHEAILAGKTVIGICLGSQLIADVLGAKVYPNRTKEIGWFNIKSTDQGKKSRLLSGIGHNFKVFHWHGDTFDLPEGALRLFESAACVNQAFHYSKNILGFQFHLEVTPDDIMRMTLHGKNELVKDSYVQTGEEIMANTRLAGDLNNKLRLILDRLAGGA